MSDLAITFYDIQSKTGCMSPNTWKTRLALNFKQLPYKTRRLAYVDIETVLKSIGAKPTTKKPAPDDAEDWYTCPVISVPSESAPAVVVEESDAIAEYLDTAYPDTPRLFPTGTKALQAAFGAYFYAQVFAPTITVILAGVLDVSDAPDAAYFRASRLRWYGPPPLEEWAPHGSEKRAALWSAARDAWAKLKAQVYDKRSGSGPWISGTAVPLYADFMVVSTLASVRALTPPDEWDRLMEWDGGFWKQVWDASLPYRVDDH